MRRIESDILVIGGGATGLGVAWDAALRGYSVVLVEKRDLTHGTTGRYHGLLHSGARYVVKDPLSAAQCISENRILRHTHASCIEDTGGLFVVTPEDEGDYPDQFKAACDKIGIPCGEMTVKAALAREPRLNRRISRVFEVPDGSADSFLAAHLTAQAAERAGARVLNYHQVESLLMDGEESGRRVTGALVRHAGSGEEIEVRAPMTINAAGPWAGQIAGMARVPLEVIAGKGTMLAFNHRIVNTVINRCKPPGDGDIFVPVHTVAVLGTTDERVPDPDDFFIEPWEIELLLSEGDKMVPGLSRARVLRAWAGVRPLYHESHTGPSREATRDIALLDHRSRDGVSGFLSILGGKWTTFRLMAEMTIDKASEQLGQRGPCITASTPASGEEVAHYWLGYRLGHVEEERLQQELICECELVTRGMLEETITHHPVLTMDDLRRDLRVGMGPCQGGFCTYRATGILHEMQARGKAPKESKKEAESPNLVLRDFLQERWKGLTPILWGLQLKQERLDELIYLSLMNADHLPDAGLKSPMSDFYVEKAEPGPEAGEARNA